MAYLQYVDVETGEVFENSFRSYDHYDEFLRKSGGRYSAIKQNVYLKEQKITNMGNYRNGGGNWNNGGGGNWNNGGGGNWNNGGGGNWNNGGGGNWNNGGGGNWNNGGNRNYNRGNDRPNKHSGAKFVMINKGKNKGKQAIHFWNYSRSRGMISGLATPYSGTDTHTSKSGRNWENWMVSWTNKRTMQQGTCSGLFDTTRRQLIINQPFGWVVNPGAPRGGYCGRFGDKN